MHIPQVPNGAAGHYLLGRICHLQRNPDAAMSHYMSALQLNPLLWSAYDELCAMGEPSLLLLVLLVLM